MRYALAHGTHNLFLDKHLEIHVSLSNQLKT
jgi:hypothetical protein